MIHRNGWIVKLPPWVVMPHDHFDWSLDNGTTYFEAFVRFIDASNRLMYIEVAR